MTNIIGGDAIVDLIKETILPTISYKKDVKFDTAFDNIVGDIIFGITSYVPSVEEPDRITYVYRTSRLPKETLTTLLDFSKRDFEKFVIQQFYDLAQEYEEHELNEWFRVGGIPFIDPHPEKGANTK